MGERSGQMRHHSTWRNGGKMMVPIAEVLVPRGTYHVPPREPLQKHVVKDAGKTNVQIRLELGGPLARALHGVGNP